MYCEFVLCAFIVSHHCGEQNLRWHKKTIILKNNFKLQIELMMKTAKKYCCKIPIRKSRLEHQPYMTTRCRYCTVR